MFTILFWNVCHPFCSQSCPTKAVQLRCAGKPIYQHTRNIWMEQGHLSVSGHTTQLNFSFPQQNVERVLQDPALVSWVVQRPWMGRGHGRSVSRLLVTTYAEAPLSALTGFSLLHTASKCELQVTFLLAIFLIVHLWFSVSFDRLSRKK